MKTNNKDNTITTYITKPMHTGQVAPKFRGACRHLLGQYDPVMHAWTNGMVHILFNENLYSAMPNDAMWRA